MVSVYTQKDKNRNDSITSDPCLKEHEITRSNVLKYRTLVPKSSQTHNFH